MTPAESLAQFQRLTDRRELAALHCVNAIQFVLAVFEAQTFAESRQMLQDALDQHRAADDAVTQFLNTHKGELHHGNANAA